MLRNNISKIGRTNETETKASKGKTNISALKRRPRSAFLRLCFSGSPSAVEVNEDLVNLVKVLSK
jgi:hypothetical protein